MTAILSGCSKLPPSDRKGSDPCPSGVGSQGYWLSVPSGDQRGSRRQFPCFVDAARGDSNRKPGIRQSDLGNQPRDIDFLATTHQTTILMLNKPQHIVVDNAMVANGIEVRVRKVVTRRATNVMPVFTQNMRYDRSQAGHGEADRSGNATTTTISDAV